MVCVALFSPLQPFLDSSLSETTDDQPGVAQEWHMLTSKYKLCWTQSPQLNIKTGVQQILDGQDFIMKGKRHISLTLFKQQKVESWTWLTLKSSEWNDIVGVIFPPHSLKKVNKCEYANFRCMLSAGFLYLRCWVVHSWCQSAC